MSRSGGAGRRIAGIALILQAGLRAFFLASFLLSISKNPRFSQLIFGNVYPLTMSVLLPAAFALAGLVAGIMLLARARGASAVAGGFCVLGLLFAAFGAVSLGYAYLHTSRHVPPQTYVLMTFNAAVYVGTLIAVARSA